MQSPYRKIVEISLAVSAIAIFVILSRLIGKFWTLFGGSVVLGFWQSPAFWVGLLISLGSWVGIRRSSRAMGFLDEVVGELSKVVWPSKNDTFKFTWVVLVMVGISSVILFVFDGLWGTTMEWFLS